ncbi:glutathione S-transferase [Luteimonas sp. SJ-92]|uniref:Glutathione S-transferase n=1 Tax=Luteimonas salinisoli TaxID=2752307 RepID=A0A853JD18_9GAMM|nr:glutathione S-transferase [Luteimonas salinisoli]NZA26517.1 glutathione S-transferase [Luteimonas salinisoli]
MAIQLHRHPLSGHSHRAQLLLSLIGLEVELVDVDLKSGAHKQPEFLRMNSFGQVPVLDDEGVVVADSNAILVYIAKKYGGGQWLPEDPVGAARVQRWLSVAAGQIAFGPAAARVVTVFGAKLDADALIARSHALLKVIDGELQDRAFLAADVPTIADVAAYSYIAHAPEGNVALDAYANVNAWLQRIEQLPGFVPMPATKVGLAA